MHHSSRRHGRIPLCALLFCFLATTSAGAYELVRHAFSGGAVLTGDGTVSLAGTVGQAAGAIGRSADGTYDLVQGFWFPFGGSLLDAGHTVPVPPAVNAIAGAAPNPFPTGTAVRFSVAESGPVKLRVFDVTGRALATLVDGPRAPGVHNVAWDGRDDSGRALGSGLYYLRIEIGDWSETRKVMKLR